MYCEVVLSSIQLKYMIGSQNFIFSFYYKRSRMLGHKLVSLDQDVNGFALDNASIDITMNENGNLVSFISVRQKCTLAQLQHDIRMEANRTISAGFAFVLNNKKVNLLCLFKSLINSSDSLTTILVGSSKEGK